MNNINNFSNSSNSSNNYGSGNSSMNRQEAQVMQINQQIPIAPPLPGSADAMEIFSAYWSVIRHLKEEDLSVLQQKMNELAPHQPAKEALLLQVLEKQDWQHSIFEEEYLTYALSAFQKGNLSKKQFTTLCFYWTAVRDHQAIRPISLFTSEGHPNQEAWNLIQQSQIKNGEPLTLETELTEENMRNLFSRMKKAPLSEQQFFIYKKEQQVENINNLDVVEFLLTKGFNLLNEVIIHSKEKPIKMQMVASATLMQEVIYEMFGENALEIDFILAISPLKHMGNNAACDQRVLSLNFLDILSLPDTADGFEAKGVKFYIHDLYHIYIASCVPKNHRYAFSRVFNILQKGERTAIRKRYIAALKDMEATFYRPFKQLEKEWGVFSLEEKFWIEVIYKSCLVYVQRGVNKIGTLDFVDVFIDYFQHQKEWKETFNIEINKEKKQRITTIINDFFILYGREDIFFTSVRKALKNILNLIELGWEIQTLIQEGKGEVAKQVLQSSDFFRDDRNQTFLRTELVVPIDSYFFAVFNDPDAFKTMIGFLPKDYFCCYLSNCAILNDELLKVIMTHEEKKGEKSSVKNTMFYLNGCQALTSASMHHLQGCLKLDLSGCDSLVEDLSSLPNSIQVLYLNYLKNLKDEDLEKLKHYSNLVYLSLEGNPFLTDKGLEHFKDFPFLTSLVLNECHGITIEGIRTLMYDTQLSYLEIKRCKQLNEETLNLIRLEVQQNAVPMTIKLTNE